MICTEEMQKYTVSTLQISKHRVPPLCNSIILHISMIVLVLHRTFVSDVRSNFLGYYRTLLS